MDWITAIGVLASMGLGEAQFSPSIELRVGSQHFEYTGRFELSRKIESNAGWIGSSRLVGSFGPCRLGASGVYREGGLWTKKTGWAEVGFALGPTTLDLRKAVVGDTNQEVALRATWRIHKNLEWEGQLVRHGQGLGKTSSLSILFP